MLEEIKARNAAWGSGKSETRSATQCATDEGNFATQEPAEQKELEVGSVTYIDKSGGLFKIKAYTQQHQIRRLFIDTETTGLDPFSSELCLIQIKAEENIFIIDVGKIGAGEETASYFSGLKRLLEDPEILKIFHNAIFDLKFIKYHLFPDIRLRNVFDTLIAEKVLEAGMKQKCTLKACAQRYLNIELDKTEQTSFEVGQDLTESQIEYVVNDVEVLPGIFERQNKELLEAELLPTVELEFSIIPAVVEIELTGMPIDTDKLQEIKRQLEKERSELHETLSEMSEPFKEPIEGDSSGSKKSVNYNSPTQVKALLLKMGYKVENTRAETLQKIDSEFVRTMVRYRKTLKLITSFVEKLPKHINPKTGRINPQFPQMGTETGRFSCKNPNLQQIPNDQGWRDLFRARACYIIITADYKQIELLIIAEYSQEVAFLDAFQNGIDLHTRTASDVFRVPIEKVTKDQRNIAKTINFGLCYGMGPQGLSNRLNISETEAQRFITAYYRAYPAVKNTLDRLGMEAVRDGFSKSILGRKRFFPKPRSFSQRKAIERKGRNTPIQSTCGDILKKAVFYIQDEIWNLDAWIINLVHDEIVVECREEITDSIKSIVEQGMLRAGRDFLKSVPVEIDINVDKVWKK